MFGVGPTELIVILVIALLVLGPRRLPELARSLGRAMGEFRRATADISSELDNARIMLEEETRAASRASQAKEKQGRGYETPAIERDAAATKADAASARPDTGTGTAEAPAPPTPTATEDPDKNA